MADDSGSMLPMPWSRFRWFLWVWHVLYLGGLLGMLALAFVQDGSTQPQQVAILAGCVGLQVLLYVLLIARAEGWPLRPWPALLYFGGSAVLWAVQWGLDLRFLWVGWALIGQMFGLLQPRYAIGGSAVLAFYFFARIRDWAIADISAAEVFGWLSMVILFLYIYSLNRASVGRSQLVRELRTAQAELAAAHANEVELAALRERERLARDLHDGLGHTLVALAVQLEAAQRLYRVDPARASAELDAMKELVRGSMDELRGALAGLRSAGLAGQPLDTALAALGAGFGERSGTIVACQVQGKVAHLPPPVADVLWRVAQEALTNVQKHAQARQVEIVLAMEPQAVMLQVCDDGVGLTGREGERRAGGGLGLAGMAERVTGVGGRLEVTGRTPHGVCVRAHIPLHGGGLPGASAPVQ